MSTNAKACNQVVMLSTLQGLAEAFTSHPPCSFGNISVVEIISIRWEHQTE